MWKRFVLATRRILRGIIKGLGFKLSILLLVFSVAVSLMMLIPSCLDRAPIYSYFISELKLPISYELTGKVEIRDKNNMIINKDVEIFIGGYTAPVGINGTFTLKFSSPTTSEICVTIKYTKPDGIIETKTEFITPRNGEHSLQREFIIYV